jgi:hypothetical protein
MNCGREHHAATESLRDQIRAADRRTQDAKDLAHYYEELVHECNKVYQTAAHKLIDIDALPKVLAELLGVEYETPHKEVAVDPDERRETYCSDVRCLGLLRHIQGSLKCKAEGTTVHMASIA